MAGDLQHATNPTAQVFLAYAAADWPSPGRNDGAAIAPAAIVEALRQLLTEAQMAYWECPTPWPTAVDSESAISRATEACDNYLLVLTPRVLADALCLQGLLFALSMNKRIVPVLAAPVAVEHLPEPLQTLGIIDLRRSGLPLGQTTEGRQLVQTLSHEAHYHQTHTQLLVRALQWERQQRDPTLLSRGAELAGYQRWLARAQRRSRHQPIQLQTLYVAESARHWGDRDSPMAGTTRWLKDWLL
ncbi:toll/interleukin-1 receptor domain-containing protein [Nodosilinea sp. LEGE 07088]|uniref:TIR domain-containing protein n=1 Tax=Nodosilinea sp. LEGE 07088 TaxID=2777968 RepID=UPI001881A026|nr:TIR domain-containing protein [Nodosilinea sp. LEGE 07088]MBE9137622.1 toll/interleukin-1 receptor domain-containing protein [Nodosilinea sp. LEGE 07088]